MRDTVHDDGHGADRGVTADQRLVVDARQVTRAGAVTLLAAIVLGIDGRLAVVVAGLGTALVAWSPRGQQLSLRSLLGL